MNQKERDDLIAVVRALSEEEREIMIDNLPVDEMLEGIKRNYVSLHNNYCKISDIVKGL